MLEIRDLRARVGDVDILKGVNLHVRPGEIHALMGPNASGKSTLAKVLAGDPTYEVTGGEVLYRGEDLFAMAPDERARAGVFLAFQYPSEVPGVTMRNFLRMALNSKLDEEIPVFKFYTLLKSKLELLSLDESFGERYLNNGFSGGEKKRAEVLQLAVLSPKMAILDETDSGLDIDALRIVADGVGKIASENGEMGILIITHYQRILNYIDPNFVHVMVDGKIAKSGGPELALEVEEEGYDGIIAAEESAV